jgi:gliding motility-associated lipoprotein GldH
MASTFTIAGCTSPSIVEDYVSVDPDGWNRSQPAVIEFEVQDLNEPVNMGIYIRNNAMYPFRNLYVFTELKAPNGMVARDTVNCILANNRGEWLGTGMGSLKTSLHKYQLRAELPEDGTYELKVFQGMRIEELKGVEDVGLLIERIPNNSK